MWEICQAAINSRKQELRNSDSYEGKKLKTAAAGLIPFLKIGVSISVCEDFAEEALRAFGLSDTAGLEEMARQLKFETSGRGDLLIDVLGTLGKLSMAELLAHHGTHVASEGLHLKPIVGQITSAGAGYVTVRKRLISIIEKTSAAARDVHKEILIPTVISKALIAPPRPAVFSEKHTNGQDKTAQTTARRWQVHADTHTPPPAKRTRQTLNDHLVNVLISFAAWYTLEHIFAYSKVSHKQYWWGLLMSIVITMWLFGQGRAFVVMAACHLAGVVSYSVYTGVRPEDFRNSPSVGMLMVAALVTVWGRYLLR